MNKKHTTRLIWIICIVIVISIFLIPQIYRNHHSAPYCNSSGTQITLEDSHTHKLNDYQKQQFTQIAKKIVDQKDGPFDWNNFQKVSLSVYKLKKKSEYGLIYKIRPTITDQRTITNSVIIKLKNRNFKTKNNVTVIGYSSGFSNILSTKN